MRRALPLLLSAVSTMFVPLLVAAPCRDDHWQPTYVHDLLCGNGVPYYAMTDGSFRELAGPYDQSGAQLCEQFGVRDKVGFTTCRDYTRVQCGCDGQSWGNATCARFLASRGHSRPGVSSGGLSLLGVDSGGAGPGGGASAPRANCAMGSLLVFCMRSAKACSDLNPVLAKLESEGACLTRVDPSQDAGGVAQRYQVESVPVVVGVRCGSEVGRVDRQVDEASLRALWGKTRL